MVAVKLVEPSQVALTVTVVILDRHQVVSPWLPPLWLQNMVTNVLGLVLFSSFGSIKIVTWRTWHEKLSKGTEE
jgi:hypothetical protein